MSYASDILDEQAAQENLDAARLGNTPSGIYRPKLSLDGDKWCALLGENLQDGVAGFGESPEDAYEDFDKKWSTHS